MAHSTTTPVPELIIKTGPKAYINPDENRKAQYNSFFGYGIPTGLIVAGLLFIITLATVNLLARFTGVSMDDIARLRSPILFLVSVSGFVIGLIWSFRFNETDHTSNALALWLGGIDIDFIAPAGWFFYWPSPFGTIGEHVRIGARSASSNIIADVESAQGTRFSFTIKLNEYYVLWPILYVRNVRSNIVPNSGVNASEQLEEALFALIVSVLRKVANLCTDAQLIHVENLPMIISKAISGETDRIEVPKVSVDENGGNPVIDENNLVTFEFSGGDLNKTLLELIKLLGGFYIRPGGVQVMDITEPDDVADAKSEERQAESRNRALKTLVKFRADLQRDHPGVDISELTENMFVDAGIAKMNIVRNSGRGAKEEKAGDFTVGAVTKN